MNIHGKRTCALRLVLLLLVLLTSTIAGLGANTPSISIGISLDLPQMRGLGGTVTAHWDDYLARLGIASDASHVLPRLFLESTMCRGRVNLRGRIEDLLTSPSLAAGFDILGDKASIHFNTRFSLDSRQLTLASQYADVILSPLPDMQVGGRLHLANAAVSLSAFHVSAQTSVVDVAYRAEWNQLQNLSTTYSVEIPSLKLGLTQSIHATRAGREVITSWYPILPPELAHSTIYADLPSATQPAIALRESRSVKLRDSECTVCGATTPQAGSADYTVDFGEVMAGDTAYTGITLNCDRHVFCWLDEVTVWPRSPFAITYAPVGLIIRFGRQRDIELDFAPTTAGRFDGTMTIRYCFATWRDRDDEVYADEIGAVEGYYSYQCTTVTLALTGVALAKPEARATYSPDKPICGQDVQFDGSDSFDPNPEGVITTYEWDFGDGTTSSEVRPVHRYSRSGTYRVRLTVWNNREMVSDPYVIDVDVAPDLVEAAAVAGAAAAAGLATHTLALAPPLLAAAVPGSVLAVASILHELGSVRFPIDQLILRFPRSWDQADVQQLIERNIPGGRVIGYFSTLHTFLIQLPVEADSASQAAAELDAIRERLAKVLPYGAQLSKNYVGLFEGLVQPAYSGSSCDLESLAADLRLAYETVRAPEAWRRISDVDVRLKPVRIAVVDSGIYADHEEFVIPLRGRSYVIEEDGALQPWYEDSGGHGTQVSGIIGAENGKGRMNGMLSGTAGHYEMQVYRVIGDMFSVWDCFRIAVSSAEDELDAWKTAVETGARRKSVVVNISLGWDLDTFPDNERVLARNTFLDLFESCPKTLFVTSAGNGDMPEDLSRSIGKQIAIGGNLHAPGGIAATNNLTVAATNSAGSELVSWSNYGSAVDIAAPGKDVYTTDCDGSYVWRVEGTSYAAAMVSGVAAAVLAIDPRLSPAEVKDILTGSPTRVSAPDGRMIPVLDFADAVRRAIESRQERNRKTLWWSAGAGLGILALGLLVLRPF